LNGQHDAATSSTPPFPGVITSGTCSMWGWVGSRAGLMFWEEKGLLPLPGFEPQTV